MKGDDFIYLRLENTYYKNNKDIILENINLNIEKGDCISIVGESGSGKSTLLKIISDLIPYSEGDIFYQNKSYKEYNPIELRKDISYIVQIPYLFGETVIDNFKFVFEIRNETYNKERVEFLLDKFNLDKDIVNKKIDLLSGGEKQRICIIRNLIYTPKILLLDEATSALDSTNANKIEKYIKDLNKTENVTVLWITHNEKQSEGIFNKKITISNGKIMEENLNG